MVTGLGPNLAESLAALQQSAGASGIDIIAVVGEPETAEAKRELMRALPIGVQPKQILWVPVIDGLHQPWEEVELDADLDGMALTENLPDAVNGEHVLSVDDLLRGDPLTTPAQVKESAAPALRGPGVRITPPVGHTTVREKRETSSVLRHPPKALARILQLARWPMTITCLYHRLANLRPDLNISRVAPGAFLVAQVKWFGIFMVTNGGGSSKSPSSSGVG